MDTADTVGLIFFTFTMVGLATASIFGAKWYIWGPKRKAKKELKRKNKQSKSDGGANLSDEERKVLKIPNAELNSQQLLVKNRAELKVEKAQKLAIKQKEEKEVKKIEAQKEKQQYKQITKEKKAEVKNVKKQQKNVKKK